MNAGGANKLLLRLPAGADVDNWYAKKVMNCDHFWLVAGKESGMIIDNFAAPTAAEKEAYRFQSYDVWPNLLNKGWEVDHSDTHVESRLRRLQDWMVQSFGTS